MIRYALLLLVLVGTAMADSTSMSLSLPSAGMSYGKDIGVYARLVIPLDAPTERINCNTLYQLELQHRRLEIEKLRAEIEMLKSMQFEND